MTQQLKFLDLFSGIGGFRTGMVRAGNKPVGWCDIDKFARKSYKNMYNTEDEWNGKDINAVSNTDWKEINKKYGKINVICGGFPCQSFSLAGKRKGFLDKTRGTLFFQVARAAKEIKPQYLLLENVKGLLNHGHGETFRTILSTLDEIGYDAEWQVLNSKNFGVPQNRERIYIIGHLRGSRIRQIFDWGAEAETNLKKLDYLHKGKHQSKDVYKDDGLSPTLSATDYKHPVHVARPLKNKTKNGWEFEQNIFDPNSIASTLRAGGGSGNVPKISSYHHSKNERRRIYNTDGVSPTVSATEYKDPMKISYFYNARKHGDYGTYDILNTNGIGKTLSTMQGGNRQPKIAYYHNSNKMDSRIMSEKGISSSIRATGHTPKVAVKEQPVEVIGSTQKNASKTDGTYTPTLTQAMGTGGGQIPMPVFKIREDTTKKGYVSAHASDSVNMAYPTTHTKRGRVGKKMAHTVDTNHSQGVVLDDHVNVREATKKGYTKAYPGDSVNMSYPKSKTRRGRVGHKVVNTLTASNTNGTQESVVLNNLRVRKLTPKECWRLQGFPDILFDKAKEVNSNSQLYKQAGNSVSIPVIEYIANRMKILD